MLFSKKNIFPLSFFFLFLFSSQITLAQNSKQLNHLAKDSFAFNRFADSCINKNANDYLIELYDKMIVDGKMEMQPFHVRFLEILFSKMNRTKSSLNNFNICIYLGKIISKYHLDENTPVLYFTESISIAKQLPNKCLVPMAYKSLSTFYSNVRHDLLKTYEFNNITIAYFKQHKINGIVDCGIDVNVGASIISYYLEDYNRGIAQLNESIEIVKKINKPKRLYDLYKRRSFYELELAKYADVLNTIDTAEMIIKDLPDREKLQNYITAIRFNVFANQGNYDKATRYSKLVDAAQLKEDNDDYFDYMNNVIKMNIQFNQYKDAEENMNNYAALLKPWNIQRWRKLYETKYLLAKKTNDYQGALNAYEKYRFYDDSVHRQKQNLVIMDQQIKYETKEKDELLKVEIKNNNIYRLVVISISLMAIIIILLIYGNFKRSKKNVHKLTLLNNEINEQKQQVEFAFGELEISNKDKDRILRVVAHDLRNPISGITAISQSILEQDEEADNIDLIRLIEKTSTHSLILINELLQTNIAKNEVLLLQKTDINNLVKQTAELLNYKAFDKHQKINLSLLSNSLYINIDENKIDRVIGNLITNAIKFSPQQSTINIGISKDETNVAISIKDNGIGIPKEMQSNIFAMVGNAKRLGTDGEKSFGLGLSICKQIITAHKGKIWVESEDGKGSCFYLSLPLS